MTDKILIKNVITSSKMAINYDLTIKHPARIIIYGPSGSGKSTFIKKLLLNQESLFDFQFDTIFTNNENNENLNGISYTPIEKIHNINDEFINNLNPELNNLLIIDDNMNKVTNDSITSDLFTKYSHHKNLSVILVLQNLFPKSKYMRDISTNATYIVLMNNPRENLQVRTLSQQIDSDNKLFVYKCYKDATKKPFSYLFLDFNNTTPEEIRLRTNIFPGDDVIAYTKLS